MTTDPYGQPVKKPNPLAWLAIGCGVVLVLFVGFIVFMVITVFGSMRSSVPYKDSVAAAQGDPRVIAALGSPMKAAFFVSGSINVKNNGGNAKMDIPLSGPKGEGTLHVQALKTAGKWTYQEMRVTAGKTEINLLEESPGTAPPTS
jgi:hypothetical protein